MSHCHTCRFAEWASTASGRRNPNRPGKCTWKGKIVLPASLFDRYKSDFEGGAIWWKDNIKCPTYQKVVAPPNNHQ